MFGVLYIIISRILGIDGYHIFITEPPGLRRVCGMNTAAQQNDDKMFCNLAVTFVVIVPKDV